MCLSCLKNLWSLKKVLKRKCKVLYDKLKGWCLLLYKKYLNLFKMSSNCMANISKVYKSIKKKVVKFLKRYNVTINRK